MSSAEYYRRTLKNRADLLRELAADPPTPERDDQQQDDQLEQQAPRAPAPAPTASQAPPPSQLFWTDDTGYPRASAHDIVSRASERAFVEQPARNAHGPPSDDDVIWWAQRLALLCPITVRDGFFDVTHYIATWSSTAGPALRRALDALGKARLVHFNKSARSVRYPHLAPAATVPASWYPADVSILLAPFAEHGSFCTLVARLAPTELTRSIKEIHLQTCDPFLRGRLRAPTPEPEPRTHDWAAVRSFPIGVGHDVLAQILTRRFATPPSTYTPLPSDAVITWFVQRLALLCPVAEGAAPFDITHYVAFWAQTGAGEAVAQAVMFCVKLHIASLDNSAFERREHLQHRSTNGLNSTLYGPATRVLLVPSDTHGHGSIRRLRLARSTLARSILKSHFQTCDLFLRDRLRLTDPDDAFTSDDE